MIPANADTMTALAWKWCRVLGINPHHHPDQPVPDPGAFPGALAEALGQVLGQVLATALGITPTELADRYIASRHTAAATWTRRDPATEE
jgi:hypothetical protein